MDTKPGTTRTLVLGLIAGLAVGNVYLPQAVAPLAARGLGVAISSAALVIVATQAGYTMGIFLIVPLVDRVNGRRLVVGLLSASSASLLMAGAATGFAMLLVASVLVGCTTVSAQIIAPLLARSVSAHRQGVTAGVLLGTGVGVSLLSRAVGGVLAAHGGWRLPYLCLAAVMLALAGLAAVIIPAQPLPMREAPTYLQLLREPAKLVAREPVLRRSIGFQMAGFAAFSAAWTAVALLWSSPAYGFGSTAIGLLSVVGLANIMTAPAAGRMVDRLGPDTVNRASQYALFGAAGVLMLGARGGLVGVVAVVVGMLLLDVAMQVGMVANQARMWQLGADAHGRRNTAYMTCAYSAGTLGSFVGAGCFTSWGWIAVCVPISVLPLLCRFSSRALLVGRRTVTT